MACLQRLEITKIALVVKEERSTEGPNAGENHI